MTDSKAFIFSELKKRKSRLMQIGEQLDKLKAEMHEIENEVDALEATARILFKHSEVQETLDIDGSRAEQDRKRYFTRLGFRDAIRFAIDNSEKGMLPREIKQFFKKYDYPYKANTEIGLRISNELNKMKKAEMLEHDTENGRYTLAQ